MRKFKSIDIERKQQAADKLHTVITHSYGITDSAASRWQLTYHLKTSRCTKESGKWQREHLWSDRDINLVSASINKVDANLHVVPPECTFSEVHVKREQMCFNVIYKFMQNVASDDETNFQWQWSYMLFEKASTKWMLV